MPPKESEPISKRVEPKVKKRPLQRSILDILPNSTNIGFKKVFRDNSQVLECNNSHLWGGFVLEFL